MPINTFFCLVTTDLIIPSTAEIVNKIIKTSNL